MSARRQNIRSSTKAPNALTRLTLKKSRLGIDVSRYSNKEALFKDLGL